MLDYFKKAFDPETLADHRKNGGFVPYDDPLWQALQEDTPYNYRIWLIAKMCYAYALDTYASGDESVFLHDDVVDHAIEKTFKLSGDEEDTLAHSGLGKSLEAPVEKRLAKLEAKLNKPQEEQPTQDQQLIALSLLGADEEVPTDYGLTLFGEPQETFVPDDWQAPDEDVSSIMAFEMCEASPEGYVI
ncbi:hypothetical protein [Helicobacter labacensis]|uniref:hypothetical protein n=1 Tax=Helicobacter labacensis TaxID=2316079 RepID=UPI000EAD12BB|nr:hypothetical protein [Helicobacter labacensis]